MCWIHWLWSDIHGVKVLKSWLTFIIWSFIIAGPTNRRTTPNTTVRAPATMNPMATLALLMAIVVISDQFCLIRAENTIKSQPAEMRMMLFEARQWTVMDGGRLQAGVSAVYSVQARPLLAPRTGCASCSLIPKPAKSIPSHVMVRWQKPRLHTAETQTEGSWCLNLKYDVINEIYVRVINKNQMIITWQLCVSVSFYSILV